MTAPIDVTPTLPVYEPVRPVRTVRPERSRAGRTRPAGRGVESSINGLLALALGLLIVVAAVGLFGGGAAANGALEPVSPESEVTDAIEIYVVQPGDTLWGIASELTADGADVRDVVDRLRVSAGGAELEVGQRIVIDHSSIGG